VVLFHFTNDFVFLLQRRSLGFGFGGFFRHDVRRLLVTL
jgi:hypothetical protein